MSACCDDTAIITFDDDFSKCNAATKFDHSTLTFDLFAKFCSRNVADTHFKRHTSLERVGPHYRNCADDVNDGRYAAAVKGPVPALSE